MKSRNMVMRGGGLPVDDIGVDFGGREVRVEDPCWYVRAGVGIGEQGEGPLLELVQSNVLSRKDLTRFIVWSMPPESR